MKDCPRGRLLGMIPGNPVNWITIRRGLALTHAFPSGKPPPLGADYCY